MKIFIATLIILLSLNCYAATGTLEVQILKAQNKYAEAVLKEQQAYITTLDKIIKDFTKKGMLDEALKVKQLKEDFIKKEKIKYVITMPESGFIKLTSMTPIYKQTGFGQITINGGTTPPVFKDKVCDDFIFAHANSILRYNIPAGSVYFSAIACSPFSKSIGFRVIADGKVIYKCKDLNRKSGQIDKIKVRLPRKAKILELVTDNLGDGDSDHSCWAYPTLHGLLKK